MKLELGHKSNFIVREEVFQNSNLDGVSIAFLSDLHLNKSSSIKVKNLISSINEINPDIILLGGDYIDSSTGLKYFQELLEFLSSRKNVIGILGNHDIFRRKKMITNSFSEFGISLLEKSSLGLNLLQGKIIVCDSSESQIEKHDLIIRLFHKPKRVINEKSDELIVAGHLHGSQIVLKEHKGVLYPGRIFYFWNRLSYRENRTLYLISRGLGDLLPIRLNCPREILLVHLQKI